MKTKPALERAISAAGSLSELARRLDLRPQHVNNWRRRGVPIDRCADIERAVAGAVTRADFYPEHFGPIDRAA